MELKAEHVKNIRSLAVCKEFLRQAVEQVDQLNEELRHQKYKRCLKNAESCLYKVWYYDEVHDRNGARRMWKWHERWLKIAEQFKEAK